MGQIVYPITVNEIKYGKDVCLRDGRAGKFCKIKPCGDEYGGKTYLGLCLGELPWMPVAQFHPEEGILEFKNYGNPAIYVFALQKVIYGGESWWGIVESPDCLRDITQDDINGQWYVQALKGVLEKGGEADENI